MKPKPKIESTSGPDQEVAIIIAELERMDVPELQKRWLDIFGYPAPKLSRADLLRRGIAYAEQVTRYGGLDPDLRNRLRRIAKDGNGEKPGTPVTLKKGTRLIREWRGTVYQVDVVGQNFIYQGRQYNSLSKIAREITGTAWSGPAFFGLNKTRVAS